MGSKREECRQHGGRGKNKKKQRLGNVGRGQRWERVIIISGLKLLMLPLITIIVLILCCGCLKWFFQLFIRPAPTMSDLRLSQYFQSCLRVTSLCELTAYVCASMHDNEKLSHIWIGCLSWLPLEAKHNHRERQCASFSVYLKAARISFKSFFFFL